MGCAVCQQLEEELERLGMIHAERAQIREEGWQKVRPSEHSRLRSAENDALLAQEIARAGLRRHKQSEHGTD